MLARQLNNLIKFARVSRSFCQSTARLNDETNKEITGSIATKFQVFRNETGIVFDIEEERRRQDENEIDQIEIFPSAYAGINLERGVNGVFEIEDLVDVLQREKAQNLCVIKVPAELKYVDYLCLVTGKSYRHMVGMAHFVRKCYKLKREPSDILPKIEGQKCKNWMAMDLGNIALHIFTRQSREYYDLESLWCLGEEYEKRIKGKNHQEDIYKKFMDEAAAASRKIDPDPVVTDTIEKN